MRLHSQMTVTQRQLKALSEELEIRFSTFFVKKIYSFFKNSEIISIFSSKRIII